MNAFDRLKEIFFNPKEIHLSGKQEIQSRALFCLAGSRLLMSSLLSLALAGCGSNHDQEASNNATRNIVDIGVPGLLNVSVGADQSVKINVLGIKVNAGAAGNADIVTPGSHIHVPASNSKVSP